MKMYRTLLSILPLLLLAGCANHGPFRADTQFVDGIVLLDGEPVAHAIVQFVPSGDEGELATGLTDENGRFNLTSLYGNRGRGALRGTYKVLVSKDQSDWVIDPRTGEGHTVATPLLPAIYLDEATTPFEVTIQRGRNRVSLELQSR